MTHQLQQELDELREIIRTTEDPNEFSYAVFKFKLTRKQLEDNS